VTYTLAVFVSTIVPDSSSAASSSTGDRTIRGIIRSGVALLDDWLTGVRDGGLHLLTGGPGSGKSTIALHFADAGLCRGERVAMLVHAHADDVKAHARYLGVDLETPLRDGRLLLLRYRSDFVHRANHSASADQTVADLARVVLPHAPTRIVIDTFSPFVMSGAPPVGPVVAALADLLERSGSSSLLTFPEELSAGYDRNLEPLVQSTAAVIRLVREDADVRRAELVSLRYPAPSAATRRFVIRAGSGVVAEHAVRAERLTLRVP
jgi:KaiC/GvpD/RAD55 family RecA-like ATPase